MADLRQDAGLRRRLAHMVASIQVYEEDKRSSQSLSRSSSISATSPPPPKPSRASLYKEVDEGIDDIPSDALQSSDPREGQMLSDLYHPQCGEDSDIGPHIPLCSFTRPLGPCRGDKAKGIPGDHIFEAASASEISQRLRAWFPDHQLTESSPDSAEAPTPSAGKRKRKEEASSSHFSVLLDAELVVDPYDSGSTQNGDDWSLLLIVFAPDDFKPSATRSKAATASNDNGNLKSRLTEDEQRTLYVGRLNFRRSTTAAHPFAGLHPGLFTREWVQTTRCQVELSAPFFKLHAESKGGSKETSLTRATFECPSPSLPDQPSPRYRLNAKVTVDLAMPQTALSYGNKPDDDGCIEARRDYALAFRDLIARLVRFDNATGTASASQTEATFTSLVEIDDQWPDRDFWQGKQGTRVPYYTLPERNTLVDYDSDSDDDTSQQGVGSNSAKSVKTEDWPDSGPSKRAKTLPPLSLNNGSLASCDAQDGQTHKVVPGEWLCHVYIQVPRSDALVQTIEQAHKHMTAQHSRLDKHTLSCHWLGGKEDDMLHISLTRPILLRAHERESFVQEVKAVLKDKKYESFPVALARSAEFVNDDNTRLFLALEVGQGHEQLHTVTRALDSRLRQLFQAKEYYEEARFHASIAYLASSKQDGKPRLTAKQVDVAREVSQDTAAEVAPSLAHLAQFRVRRVCVRVGKQVLSLKIGQDNAVLPLCSGYDLFTQASRSAKSQPPRKGGRGARRNSIAGRVQPAAAVPATAPVPDDAGEPTGSAAPPVIDSAELVDSGDRHLPLSRSLESLLLAACPDPASPQVSPPADKIKTPLYPFQKQALAWMIDRETNVDDVVGLPLPNWVRVKSRGPIRVAQATGVEEPASGSTSKKVKSEADNVSSSMSSAKAQHTKGKKAASATRPNGVSDASDGAACRPAAADGGVSAFYIDGVSGTPSSHAFYIERPRQSGGVLADAMGLGKTIEILSLVVTNPRGVSGSKDSGRSAALIAELAPEDRPLDTGATLIVAPAALMHQWTTEVQRHLHNAKVVQYNPQWKGKEPKELVRSRMAELLEGATVCLATYETLASDYQRSLNTARMSKKAVVSPLLDVFWHRIVLDEAQLFAAKSHNSNVAGMCGAMWRSHSWMCSSTPLRDGKDLFPIFCFLDDEIFTVRSIFNELVVGNMFCAENEPEAARQVRSLVSKVIWRNERRHVADQLALPPQSVTKLGVTARGLEAAIYLREARHIRKELCDTLGKWSSPNLLPVHDSVAKLRQLASHPSVASTLGYGSADTFATFFTRMHNATKREYMRNVLDGCRVIVCVDTMFKALKHEERNFVWKNKHRGGEVLFLGAHWKTTLQEWLARCNTVIDMQIADGQLTAADIVALAKQDAKKRAGPIDPGSIARHSYLTAAEAKIALGHCIGRTRLEDFPVRHRDRCVGLTFSFEIFNAEDVSADEVDRYHPMDNDAGSMEDDDWLQNILGDKYEDAEKREAAEKALRQQGERAEPVMKNRLRGKNQGPRTKDRVWGWVPKKSFQVLHTEMVYALERCETKLKDLRWTETRMQEEGVPITAAVEAQNGAQTSVNSDAGADEGVRDCIICLEPPVVAGILPCLHSACYECLCEMAKKNTNICPYCRRRFAGQAEIREMLPERGSLAANGGEGYEMSEAEGEYGIKVAALAMDILQRLQQDASTKVVVFSLWRKMLSKVYEGLYKMGIECAVFSGGAEGQKTALADFGKDGGKSVLLCPMKMSEGAAGLTLTMANVGFIMEPSLNANLLAQAKGRLNRIGQTRPTTMVQMYVKDTIEEGILALAERRQQSGRSGSGRGGSSGSGIEAQTGESSSANQVNGTEEDSFTVDELKLLFKIEENDIERRPVRVVGA